MCRHRGKPTAQTLRASCFTSVGFTRILEPWTPGVGRTCRGRTATVCQLLALAPNPHHATTHQPLVIIDQLPQSQAAAGGTAAGWSPLCRAGMLQGSCCWELGGQLEACAGIAA